jgi:hypothetical protein
VATSEWHLLFGWHGRDETNQREISQLGTTAATVIASTIERDVVTPLDDVQSIHNLAGTQSLAQPEIRNCWRVLSR